MRIASREPVAFEEMEAAVEQSRGLTDSPSASVSYAQCKCAPSHSRSPIPAQPTLCIAPAAIATFAATSPRPANPIKCGTHSKAYTRAYLDAPHTCSRRTPCSSLAAKERL